MIKVDIFKKKNVFKKENIQPDPNVYWITIFFLGFFLTIAVFIFGIYLFRKINKEQIVSYVGDNKKLEQVSKKRIDAVLNIFTKREKFSNEIINSSSNIVDPSM